MDETVSRAMIDLLVAAALFGGLAWLARRAGILARVRSAWPEIRTNLALYSVDLILVVPIIVALDAWLIRPLRARFQLVDWASDGSIVSIAAVALLGIAVGDLIGYWRHRLEHHRWLWPAHAVHHSDRAMTWLTLLRFHPINRLSTFVIDAGLLCLLGFPLWAVLINNFVRHYYGYFIHVDLGWDFGRWGRWMVSPAMHKWHHVRAREHAGRNFATVFAVWDRMFGTFYLPGPCRVETGVDDPMGDGAAAQLLYPFRPSAYARERAPRPGLLDPA